MREKEAEDGEEKERKTQLAGWVNSRNKNGTRCFSSSLSRESARQKSHADLGVNYTYRIT